MKKRKNLSKESYIIDSKDCNQIIIHSSDGSIDIMPRHRLVKSAKNFPLATIKNSKRGISKEIKSYDTKNDTCSIIYEYLNGKNDTIKAFVLRVVEAHTRPNKWKYFFFNLSYNFSLNKSIKNIYISKFY